MNTGLNKLREEEAKRLRDGVLKLIGMTTVGWVMSKLFILALIIILV